MRFNFSKTVFFILAAVFISGCQSASAPKIMPPAERLRGLGWTLENGTRQKIADRKGEVVILDFWATYCEPCLREIPDLMALQNKHKNEGMNVIGLHVGGPDDRPKIPEFVQKLNIDYELGYPEDNLVSTLFGDTSAIPQTFVFDREGNLVQKFTGYGPQIKADMESAVKRALAK